MKKTLIALGFLTILTGCDTPQRTRIQTANTDSIGTPPNNSWTTGGTSGGTTTGTTTGGTTGTGTVSTPGFENCDLSDKYHNIDIGHFGICQSTQDETVFKFRTSLGSTGSRICLIPIYKDASGSSTYLGNPQCTYTQSNVIIQGKVYKDRSGYSQYPVNGVIVMRENLTAEYFKCMHGYTNWPANACQSSSNVSYCNYWGRSCPYGPGNTQGTPCDYEARNYMSQICNSFKSKYGNAYTDIRTK